MTPHLAFHDPAWLLLLLAVPGILWLRRWRKAVVWLVPFAAAWHRPSGVRPSWWPLAAMIGGLGLLALALARPQRVQERWLERTEGYDLMLVVDISPSMLTEDYRRDGERINRFEAVKPVIRTFLEGRPRDRIGMVVFSGRAYTLAPLTFDHDWLWRRLEQMRGEFFRAYDTGTMEKAFRAIDCTQRIQFEPRRFLLTAELFAWFAVPGVGLLVLAAYSTRPRFPHAGRLVQ